MNRKCLNQRELKVLDLISKGKSNTQIAKEVNVSVHTIKVNVASILYKLKVKDRLQAVVKAIKEKLIDI